MVTFPAPMNKSLILFSSALPIPETLLGMGCIGRYSNSSCCHTSPGRRSPTPVLRRSPLAQRGGRARWMLTLARRRGCHCRGRMAELDTRDRRNHRTLRAEPNQHCNLPIKQENPFPSIIQHNIQDLPSGPRTRPYLPCSSSVVRSNLKQDHRHILPHRSLHRRKTRHGIRDPRRRQIIRSLRCLKCLTRELLLLLRYQPPILDLDHKPPPSVYPLTLVSQLLLSRRSSRHILPNLILPVHHLSFPLTSRLTTSLHTGLLTHPYPTHPRLPHILPHSATGLPTPSPTRQLTHPFPQSSTASSPVDFTEWQSSTS